MDGYQKRCCSQATEAKKADLRLRTYCIRSYGEEKKMSANVW